MTIKLLIGGSPCSHWSISNKNREVTVEGLGWELFKNFVIAKEKFNPDYFLYENNNSIAKIIKEKISEELGVGKDSKTRLTYINSALVSAQNRNRFYVTNFGNIEQPIDRGISFHKDIKETDYKKCLPYKANKTQKRIQMWGNGEGRNRDLKCPNVTYADKTYTLMTKQDRFPSSGFVEFEDFFRYLTVEEYEQLQTLPKGYTKGVSRSAAERGIGNGWTVEVIIHILEHALKNVDKNDEILVLSLYDGIGTGRYCLDKMGFKNLKYYAYEIDKKAIQIANNNFPDIIQLGDVFNVRDEKWCF